MKCDACGKEMTDEQGNSSIGCQLSYIVEPPNDPTFAQKQMGKYQLGRTYRACWECWLKSLRIRPYAGFTYKMLFAEAIKIIKNWFK